MFKQKISISINAVEDNIKLLEEFEILMANYVKTGQILGEYETPYIAQNELIAYQTTLEEGSLAAEYNDKYVNQRIRNMEEWCNSKIKYELVGHMPNYKGPCNCTKPEFYILFSYALNDTGQIDCGTCGKIVPLYKLTQLSYQDRWDLISWERDYKSCDYLQLGCTVGEKWATKQMSDYSSQLSRSGINICSRIRELTGIQTYYYLHNYRRISERQDKARPCPSCNGKWLLSKQLLGYYDFKCDNCSLVSVFSPNTA